MMSSALSSSIGESPWECSMEPDSRAIRGTLRASRGPARLAPEMQSATCVEAASAYAAAARREAGRRGLAERVEQLQGDFVELARRVGQHEVVTLDRGICCYDDLDS